MAPPPCLRLLDPDYEPVATPVDFDDLQHDVRAVITSHDHLLNAPHILNRV